MQDRPPEQRMAWLAKALYESAEECRERLYGVGEAEARRHPCSDEWSLLELAGHLRDRETITAYHLEQLAFESATTLRLHDLEWLEPAPDYSHQSLRDLLSRYGALRRRTCHLIISLADRNWERRARHPFQGQVTAQRLAHDLHEHDLAHLWQARALCAALESTTPAPRT